MKGNSGKKRKTIPSTQQSVRSDSRSSNNEPRFDEVSQNVNNDATTAQEHNWVEKHDPRKNTVS